MYKTAFTDRLTIAAAPERVFAILDDPGQRQHLMGGEIETCDSAAVGENKAGPAFKHHVRRGGRAITYSGYTTVRSPPNHFALRIEDRNSTLHADYRLTPVQFDHRPGTLMSCTFEVHSGRKLHHLLILLFGGSIRRYLRRQAVRLQRMAESYSRSPAAELESHGVHLWHVPRSHYRGLMCWCAPGVHSAALQMLLQHGRRSGAVLDLAAGTGAWLARLMDAGFKNLSALELNAHWFELSGVNPLPLDLNNDFAKQVHGLFELVTAIEIVEHLDCPRHFLRQARALMTDDGHLLLSTPNIAHWRGRLTFLRRGEHRYFGEAEYDSQRHISPVTDLHMRLMFREIGLRVIDHRTVGSYLGPLRKLVTLPLSLPFRILCGPHTQGDVSIYLVTKCEPDQTSAGRNSHYLDSHIVRQDDTL